ncbi:MAG: SCP2 sterol-binding domain-containing protein [Thermodesulfobacteriota bacterium]
MADIMKSLEGFFKRIEGDAESKEIRSMCRRIFQFRLKDGDPFFLEAKNGKFSVKKGEVPNPDFLRYVTLVETDTQTLVDIIQGRIKPSDPLEDGRMWMSGLMAVKVQNFWLLRLFRIGQSLRC